MADELVKISDMIYSFLMKEQFSIKGSRATMELTNQGHSFCFDLGLFMGELIIKSMPDVIWEIGKGPKTYQGRNMPVIKNEKAEYDILGIAINGGKYSISNSIVKDWHDQY